MHTLEYDRRHEFRVQASQESHEKWMRAAQRLDCRNRNAADSDGDNDDDELVRVERSILWYVVCVCVCLWNITNRADNGSELRQMNWYCVDGRGG